MKAKSPMSPDTFGSLEALEAIVTNGIPEGLTLEYKRSAVFRDGGGDEHLCKAVTAFANSVGGHFVIGIEAHKGRVVRLDEGVALPSKHEWIHQSINSNTYPPVDLIEVVEIPAPSGVYYVIKVEPSPKAPHQSLDHKYYKRRGPLSVPMEHYEIEDVRNRPKAEGTPLRVELVFDDLLVLLRFRNEHASDSATNIGCRIETNFEMNRRGVESLCARGLRSLRPQSELHFVLDSSPTMIEKIAEPEMHIHISYDFRGTAVRETISYYLADLIHSAIVRLPLVTAVNTLSEKVEQVHRELKNLRSDNARLLSIADGSGLRLSARTMDGFRGSKPRFAPTEFDWRGYEVILGIPRGQAISLTQIFHAFGHPNGRKAEYEKLPQTLRQKFEEYFEVAWETSSE